MAESTCWNTLRESRLWCNSSDRLYSSDRIRSRIRSKSCFSCRAPWILNTGGEEGEGVGGVCVYLKPLFEGVWVCVCA